MKFNDAAMELRPGLVITRADDSVKKFVGYIGDGVPQIPVFDRGVEPLELVPAFTQSGVPVLIMRGVWSKELFDPYRDDATSGDWIVLKKEEVK